MPVGDLPGWHQVFADNFANDNYPLGTFSNCTFTGCPGTPGFRWGATPDGSPDTMGHCAYYPSQTLSVTGGVMTVWAHTASNGVCMVASLFPLIPKFTYMVYSVRFRADAALGYKLVDLLWPVNDVDGEIDYPENQFQNPVTASLHTIAGDPNPAQIQRFVSAVDSTSWHTATTIWTPTGLIFLLDGTAIGSTTTSIPQTPHTLILRAESAYALPTPSPSAQGNLQIDWVTVYSYAPSPTISSVSPSNLGQGEQTANVEITGPGFTPDASVSFSSPGVTVVASPTLVTPNVLSVPVRVSSSTPVGTSSVTVTEAAGTGTCGRCLTVDPAPKPSSVSSAAMTSTSSLTVNGSYLQTGLKVSTTAPDVRLGPATTVGSTSFTVPVKVRRLTPAGFYDLTVTNPDGGVGTCSGCLEIITVPGAPVIGTATYGNAQATVAFSPPSANGGSPVTSYTVFAYDPRNPTNGGQTVTGVQSPITITGLINGDHYCFRVRAVNAAGPGPLSSTSNGVVPR
jgi:hypothetical protein